MPANTLKPDPTTIPITTTQPNGTPLDDTRYPFIERGWVVIEVPEKRSEEWFALNWSDDVVITAANEKVTVQISNNDHAYRLFEVNSGAFLSVDRGEFGGRLDFIPDYGETYNVSEYASKGIFELDDELYSVWGAGHGEKYPYGRIFHLVNKDDKWAAADSYEEFAGTPHSFLSIGTKAYIVTSESLLSFENGKLAKLYDDAFWSLQSPNSVVLLHDRLYIGMRGGVAEYDLGTRETQWWVKKGNG
jgi:hypothetical protein